MPIRIMIAVIQEEGKTNGVSRRLGIQTKSFTNLDFHFCCAIFAKQEAAQSAVVVVLGLLPALAAALSIITTAVKAIRSTSSSCDY